MSLPTTYILLVVSTRCIVVMRYGVVSHYITLPGLLTCVEVGVRAPATRRRSPTCTRVMYGVAIVLAVTYSCPARYGGVLVAVRYLLTCGRMIASSM